MYKIVLLRHGESLWNKENRFTGWTDVDLTELGVDGPAQRRLLKAEGFAFDHAFTSVLKRANKTLNIVLEELDALWLPVTHSWRLNERHYGALQGLNKAETAAKYGDEQVLVWRRSYDTPPPALEDGDERIADQDPRYAELPAARFPPTECLKGYRCARGALLGDHDRAPVAVRQAAAGGRAWQQPACPDQVSRRRLRPGDRWPEHSDGAAPRL